MFLNKNVVDLSTECGFFKSHINRLCFQFEKNFPEQNEEYLCYIKNEEKSILARNLNK